MKRILALLFASIILILCCTPCFAESVGHDVYAKYIESETNCGRDVVKDGKASVTLSDGIIVSASDISLDNCVLYVKEVSNSDKTAMQWFSQCLSNQTKVFYPLNICLLNENGQITLANDIDILISIPATYNNKVLFLDTNGNVTSFDCNYENNTVSFKSKLTTYCVIIPFENQPISPKTGDVSKMNLWSILLIVSAMGLVACFVFGKRKKAIK